MSIYASLDEIEAWDYDHSGHMPKRRDPHKSSVDLAYIPTHLSKRQSWLRLGVDTDMDAEGYPRTHVVVLLDRKGARKLRDQLHEWVEQIGEWE